MKGPVVDGPEEGLVVAYGGPVVDGPEEGLVVAYGGPAMGCVKVEGSELPTSSSV